MEGNRIMMLRVQSHSSSAGQGGLDLAFSYLYAFRLVVVGLALVGAGPAWTVQAGWPLAACLCIGLGELLGTRYYIGVLRWAQREGTLRWPAQARPTDSAI